MKKFWYRFKILRGLKRRYTLDTLMDKIMREWVTDCIINRKQEPRRKELVDIENKIKEQELFLEWLKTKSVFKD